MSSVHPLMKDFVDYQVKGLSGMINPEMVLEDNLFTPPETSSSDMSYEDFVSKWDKEIITSTNVRECFNDLQNVEVIGKSLASEPPSIKVIRDGFQYFLMGEEMIKNNNLFWVVFGTLLVQTDLNDGFLDNSIMAMKRYDRHKEHLNDKIKWSNLMNDSLYERKLSSVEVMRKELMRYNINDEITIYRGFCAREGHSVRKSNDENSPEYFMQNEGKGLSYSLDRQVAVNFSTRFFDTGIIIQVIEEVLPRVSDFPFDYKKMRVGEIIKWMKDNPSHPVSELTFESIREFVESRRKKVGDDWSRAYNDFSARPVVATFKVKKIDIAMTLNLSNQKEVVVMPENVKLERYDLVSSEEIKSSGTIHDFQD